MFISAILPSQEVVLRLLCPRDLVTRFILHFIGYDGEEVHVLLLDRVSIMIHRRPNCNLVYCAVCPSHLLISILIGEMMVTAMVGFMWRVEFAFCILPFD